MCWLSIGLQDVLNGLMATNHSTSQVYPIAIVTTIRDACPTGGSDFSLGPVNCIEAVVDGRKGGVPDGY